MSNPRNGSISPDSRYLSLYGQTPFQPIFIMGSHRSGTTILYRLLAESGCFNVVTAYHVMKHRELVSNKVEGRQEQVRAGLASAFAQVKDRVIDEVPAHLDAPAEYGFIMSEQERRPRVTPENLPSLLDLCHKIQFVSDPNRPLILKNPWDAVRFLYIKEVMPTAKFIFINRHPLPVMSSFLRATRSILAAPNGYLKLLAPWYNKIYTNPVQLWISRLAMSSFLGMGENLMGKYITRVTEYFVQNIGSMPQSDYVMLRYEDLCADPNGSMSKVFQFLSVTPERTMDLGELIRPRKPNILPGVRDKYLRIEPRLEPYLKFHHYSRLPSGL